MSADILTFPPRTAASRLQQALAGCMRSCWQTYCGDPVDMEAVARLHRVLEGQAIGRRKTQHIQSQIAFATTWLEVAHRRACERASEDGEYVSETADHYARIAVDCTGVLALLSMCTDLLQPASPVDMDDAWRGLELLEG
jgi:hypothetical protein